tara:strand:+ start:337 stop:492 length:156 start_codon:yes stop_codon:yes gene_type:complete
MLGNIWKFENEKTFVSCQSLFRKGEKLFEDRASIATRGIIVHDAFFRKKSN